MAIRRIMFMLLRNVGDEQSKETGFACRGSPPLITQAGHVFRQRGYYRSCCTACTLSVRILMTWPVTYVYWIAYLARTGASYYIVHCALCSYFSYFYIGRVVLQSQLAVVGFLLHSEPMQRSNKTTSIIVKWFSIKDKKLNGYASYADGYSYISSGT